MTRKEIFQTVRDRHGETMDNSCRWIMNASASDARTALSEAVRALSGVSSDPDTVPDIMRLVDTYVSCLDRSDKVNVRTDVCWRDGVHGAHTWLSAGRTYRCEGQPDNR